VGWESMAERVGFEPTTDFTRTRFPGERPRPLGDLSKVRNVECGILNDGLGSGCYSAFRILHSALIWAERVGFEPTESFTPSLVFETSSINRSDTSPGKKGQPLRADPLAAIHLIWRAWRVSNPRPLSPQPNALSTELQAPDMIAAFDYTRLLPALQP
jgi:hypothetical protein